MSYCRKGRSNQVKGKKDDRSAEKTSRLFATDFDSQVKEEQIVNYLKKPDVKINCKKMTTKTDKYIGSFKGEVATDNRDKIKTPMFGMRASLSTIFDTFPKRKEE